MTQQMTIFDLIYEPYKITKPIRLIELFGGIGSQSKALERLGANFTHWKLCEWAIPSILAYKEIHQDYLPNYKKDFSKDMTKEQLVDYLYNKGISSNYNDPMKREQINRLGEKKLRDIYNAILSENNLVNISSTKGEDLEINDTDKYDYILCYSFPCQDLSVSGKMKGMSRDSGTRSGLLWQVERLLNECKKELPQILLMENVPQVISDQNIKDFQEWENFLESIGYKNYVQVINATEVGYPNPIPQNRQRCFMISILGDYVYHFPEVKKRTLNLIDMLEDEVDDRYLLSEKILKCFTDNNNKFRRGDRFLNNIFRKNNDVAMAITTRPGQRVTDNFVIIPEATKQGFDVAIEGDSINLAFPNSKTRRGRVGHGVAQTLLTSNGQAVLVVDNKGVFKVRRYTGKENYRLMAFDDIDYERARKVISENWIGHTAGDSIVVNVLCAIFKNLM